MKPTAYLINTSRGGLVNEPDLCAVLKEKRIAGAALGRIRRGTAAARPPLFRAKQHHLDRPTPPASM